jgi:hypothetical protein
MNVPQIILTNLKIVRSVTALVRLALEVLQLSARLVLLFFIF